MRAFDAPCLVIEEAQVIMHKADDPDFLRDFFNTYVLTGKDPTEIDLAFADANPSAVRTVIVRL